MIVLLHSLFNLLWILCNSALINFCQFALWCLVRPFSRASYRYLMGTTIQALWVEVTNTCFPRTKLQITGDIPFDTDRPAIILCNHQVDADWWYIWQAARASNGAGNIKIVLKEQLKYVPIIGWGMRLFEFLFLRRSLAHDSHNIKKYMKGLIDDEFPFWLVFFPEGTTMNVESRVKSKEFSKRSDRPEFDHLLLPRSTGLDIVLDGVKDAKPDIYDLTMAFPSYSGEVPTAAMGYTRRNDTEIPSMKSLLSGRGPEVVHMYGQKYAYEDVAENVEAFLDERWKEKEERLKYFIDNQKFPRDDLLRRTIRLPLSYTAVIRLWIGFTCLAFGLPVVVISFFPLYTVWVVYCFVSSVYDRTTSFWWPYISNLLLQPSKTGNLVKLKTERQRNVPVDD